MDLQTHYLGLALKHPLVASSGPLSSSVDGVRRLEDGGASAIVLASLFEEQLRHENEFFDHLLEAGTEQFAESLDYFPAVEDYYVGPENYLNLIRDCVAAVDVPVIASLNGITKTGWVEYAKEIAGAGAKAIELNIFYIPADITLSGAEIEQRYIDVVKSVADAVDIPVAVKMNPFFSSTGEVAVRLVEAGAQGLVLFNRFYQPDFDLDAREVVPNLELSSPSEIRLPLLWIAILHGRVNASLAATRGVYTAAEVLKYLMAGADAVMSTSALLRNGVGHTHKIVESLVDWMERHQFDSVEQLKGSMSQQKVADPSAFERANYIKTLQSYKSPYIA